MRSSINLASPKKKTERHIQKFLVVSLVVFGLAFLFAGSLLGYFLYLRNQISTLVTQEDQLRAAINAAPREKVNALVLKDRLSNISRIIAARGSINTKVDSILSVIPDSLNIASFEIIDNTVKVKIATRDLSALNSFLENDIQKLENDPDTLITRSDINQLQLNPDTQEYQMDLTFELKQ